MRKNCYECKHFEKGSNSTSPSEDIYPEGNYCHKQEEANENKINDSVYLSLQKRCFEK